MLRSLRAGVTTVRDLGMNKTGLLREAGESRRASSTGRSCSSAERRSSRPAATRTGVAARRRARTRCVVPSASRFAAAPISSRSWAATTRSSSRTRSSTAVVDETHRNGLKITAHATYDACIRRMLEFGVDTIEHGGAMSDETIQLLLDRGTYIITTFAPLRHAGRRGRGLGHAGVEGRGAKEAQSPTSRATTGSSRRRRRACRSSSAPTPAARSCPTT